VQVARCHPAPHPPRHRRPPRGGADWRRSGSPRSGGGCRRVPVPILDGVAVARGDILGVPAVPGPSGAAHGEAVGGHAASRGRLCAAGLLRAGLLRRLIRARHLPPQPPHRLPLPHGRPGAGGARRCRAPLPTRLLPEFKFWYGAPSLITTLFPSPLLPFVYREFIGDHALLAPDPTNYMQENQ
jgi:hypothetical protein